MLYCILKRQKKISQHNDSDNDNNHNRNLHFRPLFFIVITINTTNIAIILLFSFVNICEFFVCLVFLGGSLMHT